jgi:hypothetical protein
MSQTKTLLTGINFYHIYNRGSNGDIKQLSYSTVKIPKDISVINQFSHFFNAYTQAINKRHKRSGSLFEKNFERK